MTEYIENPLSGKLRGVTYEDGKIIDVHIRDTDDVVKVFVPMASEKEATGMMDVRKKLVDLIFDSLCRHIDKSCKLAENIADHLISNGVTVQEWISVGERLPDLIPCNVGTAYSEAVIAWTSGRKAMIAVWDGIDWIAPFDYWEAWGEEITHWMPLPEPPKGE